MASPGFLMHWLSRQMYCLDSPWLKDMQATVGSGRAGLMLFVLWRIEVIPRRDRIFAPDATIAALDG